MALDEELSDQEKRVLLVNKAHVVVVTTFLADGSAGASRANLVEITKRMAELAEAITPETRQ